MLVTGGTGALGRATVERLRAAGYEVRVMSRRARSDPGTVLGDLFSGKGIREALQSVDTIVHAASATRQPWRYGQVDVEGTRRLLGLAAEAGVRHLLYVSIVGMERASGYPYYRYKLRAESVVKAGPVPWSILRAAQFPYLIDLLLRFGSIGPFLFVPRGWKFQVVDIGDVADRIVRAVAEGPRGTLEDFCGPEQLSTEQYASAWLQARRLRKRVVPVLIPGRTSRAFGEGKICCAGPGPGRRTWAEWLAARYRPDAG